MEQVLSHPSLVKRLESLGYVDQAVDIPLSIAPDTELDYVWRPLPEFVPIIGALGRPLYGHEVNPFWWGLYNWARESDTYRPRLGEVSRGIEIIMMYLSLQRI